MGRNERLAARRNNAVAGDGVVTAAHEATFAKHGLPMPQVLEWVKFFGGKILPFLMELIAALSSSKTATPPTEAQLASLSGHGVSMDQAALFTSAGLDVTQILKWLSDFASSGKLPQLIQIIMTVIALIKPNLPPAPTPAQATPQTAPQSQEDE